MPPYALKELKIEVTQKCPLNCIHCSSDAHPAKSTDLDLPLVLRLMADSKELGVEDIVFSGGEPLVWPHIMDAVSTASDLTFNTSLYTTGRSSLEEKKGNSKFAKNLKKAGLQRAIFSIYGRKSIYERVVRVAGSYEHTLTNIHIFKDNGIEVEIHFVPLKINFRELAHVVDFAHTIKINKVSVLRFVPHGRGALLGKSIILSNQENLELREQIRLLRQTYPTMQIRLGSPFNFLLMEKDIVCKAGLDRLIIGPDGLAYPCDAFKNYQNSHSANDSVHKKSIRDIWENSYLCQEARNYLLSEPYEECGKCIHFKLCKSGCLAQKIIRNDNFRKDRDPDCIAGMLR